MGSVFVQLVKGHILYDIIKDKSCMCFVVVGWLVGLLRTSDVCVFLVVVCLCVCVCVCVCVVCVCVGGGVVVAVVFVVVVDLLLLFGLIFGF